MKSKTKHKIIHEKSRNKTKQNKTQVERKRKTEARIGNTEILASLSTQVTRRRQTKKNYFVLISSKNPKQTGGEQCRCSRKVSRPCLV